MTTSAGNTVWIRSASSGYLSVYSLSDGRSLTARKVVVALGLKGFAQTPPRRKAQQARTSY